MSYNGLTNQGLEYLTRCQVESKPVVFSKVKIGNGNIPMGSTGETTTDLYSFKKEIEILNKEQVENSIKMEILINNFDVLEEFYVKEIGVYVMDNDVEKLYWYINKDRPSPLPDKNTPAKHRYILHLETSQMESIILNYTGLDLMVDKEFVETKFNEAKDRVKAVQFPTIADLQSRKNLKVGDIVEVLGYYKAGDGAGHKKIITSDDDGSGVQLSNKLWANIVHNGEVNIKWLGAKGDGIIDDSKSFNINYDLYIPKGTYLLNKTISMNSRKSIRGENMFESVILLASDIDGIHVSTDCTLNNFSINSNLSNYNHDVIKIGDDTFKELSRIDTMCGINISGISSTFNNLETGTANLFHILFSGCHTDGTPRDIIGYWGLNIENIRYLGKFNRVFKCESIVHKNDKVFGWLTYSLVKDVKGWKARTAIENVITYETGDYDTNSLHPELELLFKDCNFECFIGNETSEHGFISDGLPFLFDNVVLGDSQFLKLGYYPYKIKYYKSIKNYGNILTSNPIFTVNDLSFIDIEGYTGDKFSFIMNHCKLKSSIKNKRELTNIRNYVSRIMYEPNQVNKKLLWIYSYSKRKEIFGFTTDPNMRFVGSMDINTNSNIATSTNISFSYNTTKSETPMKAIVTLTEKYTVNMNDIDFVYTEDENEVKIGLVTHPGKYGYFLPTRKNFRIVSEVNGLGIILDDLKDITEEEYAKLKKVEVLFTGTIYTHENIDPSKITGFNLIVNSRDGKLETVINGTKFELTLNQSSAFNINKLNSIYHMEKMKQENVYDDYISYMDEKTVYDKRQRKLEQDRQLAYQEALKENPNLTYEEFLSMQPMTLNLSIIEEPQPSETLKKFIEKYL